MKKTAEVFLAEFLSSLKIEKAQHEEGLSLFPLTGGIESKYDYLTLDEAFDLKALSVKEIGAGSVPDIAVENNGEKDVFIMDGEELVGAKQNRTVNISMIIPAGKKIKIPVSCVEAGRWQNASETFAPSKNMSYAGLRRTQKESAIFSSEEIGEFRSDQGKTWAKIAETANFHDVDSPTGAMNDIYKKQAGRLSAMEDAFKPVKGQIGAVFAMGGRVFGMDVFDKQDTWRKLMQKIMKSYMLEVLSSPATKQKPGLKKAEDFIEDFKNARMSSRKSPGAGVTLSLAGNIAAGTSLYAAETAVHTAGFAKSGDEKKKDAAYRMSASDRRDNVFMLDGDDELNII